MSTTKLNIGKIPISKGEYQEGTTYQRLNQVTMLGSTYQSKIDDNTSAPAQMGADGAVENINTDKWLCIAVGNVSVAKKVVYNNETSGLEAGNVQEAIDEVSIQYKTAALYPKALTYTDGYFVRSDGELNLHDVSRYYGYFKVTEGEIIVYTGNYGGACLGIAYYDANYKFLSGESKENLGTPATYEFIVPANAVYAIASTFNGTFDVYIKDGVIDKLSTLEKNKIDITTFNESIKVIQDKSEIERNTAALYSKNLSFTTGYFIKANGDKSPKTDAKYYGYFKVAEGESIRYEGDYGGACLGIAYYDANYKFLSGESKENLGGIIKYFTVPIGAVYAIVSTYKDNLDIRLSDGIIHDIVVLKNTKAELNSDVKQSLSKKLKGFDNSFAYLAEVDKAILFAAFIPNEGYENDDISILALSAYYNNEVDTKEPTRFDLWIMNITKSEYGYKYINKDVASQSRYQKIYYTDKMGTLYIILDTDVLRNHINQNGKYTYLIWGSQKFTINMYSSIKDNPFLTPSLWEETKENNTKDFTIAWFGTSIPANSYPAIVGKILGCKVYNEAVGESLVRLGWGKNCIASGDTIDKWGCSGKDTSKFNPISNTLVALAKSLSASIEEKQYLIDNFDHFKEITNYTGNFSYTNEQIKGFSYENKLLKYIDSSRQDYIKTDLIIFDHGHNDLNPDGDPVWSSYDIGNRTKDNYWGAMNFLMDIIRKYNPHQNVCQISHYQGNVDYSADFYKVQQKFAEHWGIPFMELYKVTQLSTTEKVRTSGWWGYTDGLWHESGFVFKKNPNGTFTTNQSCIIQYDFGISNGSYDTTTQTFTSKIMEIPTTTVSRDIKEEDGKTTCLLSPRESFMKDRLHPVSDKSKVAVNRIAEWLASMLNSIYKIQ